MSAIESSLAGPLIDYLAVEYAERDLGPDEIAARLAQAFATADFLFRAFNPNLDPGLWRPILNDLALAVARRASGGGSA